MDAVASSRVSSQLLKGVRAASHLDNWWVLLHWAGCLASYWRGLGQLHTWTTDGWAVALSRVSSQLLKGVRAASHLDNWWMLLHWAGCLASYWKGLGQLHTWTTDGNVVALSRVSSQLLKGVRAASHLDNWWMLLHWAGCLASYWRGLGQLHTWTTDGCCCIEQGV